MTSTLLQFPRLNAPKLHQLPNGLTIVAEQMPIEAVNLSLWIKIGSAVESDAINGMAHFLEHMIFKGTEQLASGEFERRIEERGAVTNAATSQDYTHYYITTAPKDFAELAPLQIDVVFNASIPDDAFERERLVVLEEIRRSDDNPRRRTFRRAMETAFNELPYRRPVLGPEAVIAQLKPQQMRDFHASWYQPQSITAVAVGNLPEEELIAIIAEKFTQTINTQHSALKIQHSALKPEPAFTEIVRGEFVDESLQQARIIMVWRVPGLKQLELTYGLDVLAGILGHGRTSRLVQDLREERGLVSSISVSNMSNLLQGTFYISAKCAVENIPAVEDAIAQHMARLQIELISEKEIERVRRRVANRFIFGNETPSDRAGLYGYYQSLVGDLEPAFNYPAYIQAQNATNLMQAANQYLDPDAYGVVVMKPL
ncbi:insulinase family protein [Nostocaceae cyanobacterium CENA369]|uniref:Insulinase family protein n=1 Tax=Dendronalium phyllosphericum CENA369 TaxID=1725256 RepID=A0A8J7LCH1_9NOST|nr:pitrilysin family protein [Dendronalium phyllosphericum]MBH8572842.1 insulinase family protein [Dendronalium phyllosphericum CENA369]